MLYTKSLYQYLKHYNNSWFLENPIIINILVTHIFRISWDSTQIKNNPNQTDVNLRRRILTSRREHLFGLQFFLHHESIWFRKWNLSQTISISDIFIDVSLMMLLFGFWANLFKWHASS
jgi:hypothetical protein